MRSLVPGVVVAVSCVLAAATAGLAAGDELRSALDQPLYEASHAIDVTVEDGVATYKVQRVFVNPGKVADEARLEIDLPYGAAATGLRIRARSQWFDGELMEAEKAARMYQELTGRGVWQPKDPAILYWRWADKLGLQVFPVLPGETSTVEYTLTVPTRYRGGRVFLSYPRLAADAAPNLATPVFHVRPGWGDATTMVKVDGVRVSRDAPIVLAAPVEPAWLAAIEHEDSASYVASELVVEASAVGKQTFAAAKLAIDLEHTYRSDLRIVLYTPAGAPVEVFGGGRGGEAGKNDVRGTFDLKLPAGTPGAGTWRLVVSDHAALDAGTLERWGLTLGTGAAAKGPYDADDTPIFVPDAPENASDGGVAMIELAPPPITEVAARLGRVIASPAHAFGRLEIDAAPQLRALPKRAQIVFVLDASHSMGPAGIAAQLDVVRAYLAHVPDAAVELVAYRRKAARVFGGFVPAGSFAARLGAVTLVPGNGSALDEGIRVAAAALAGRTGPTRVVLVTDALLRPSWTNPRALAALKRLARDTVVHVITTELRDGGAPAITRDDTHALAPLALAHHGILANLEGPDRAGKDLVKLVLGLVRPVQIDHFAVKGFDLAKGRYDDSIPDVLHEGDGVRLVVDAAAAPARVELTGMIWGDRFRRVVPADAAFSRAAAGWVFSEDDHGELSPAEMMKVAVMGRAVSPVTSYLAVEPGTRPSTIGLERHGFGAGRGGLGLRGSGAGGGGAGRVPPDPRTLLAAAVATCVKTHKPAPGWRVRMQLDTTYDEVVDVAATPALPLTSCLVEAAWAVRLPAAYDLTRESFDFELF